MPRYRLARPAVADLRAIFRFGIERFGVAQADDYHAGLFDAFRFLAENPLAARLRREVDPPVRVWRYKAHLIFYDVLSGGVRIVRVRHGHEDWMNG
ncbi:MAG: type II toxin-antitoxin system RelE/ParE family toxin [Sphingomonadaceae bacterium]|nr:type II toxin-antitoxin system RelE/ParE family toxin [Sphingomonadaceae bacterium]